MNDDERNGWSEYKLLITEAVERHEEQIEKLRDEVHFGFEELKVAVAQLKIKAGMWGAMSGILVVVAALSLAFAKKLLAG